MNNSTERPFRPPLIGITATGPGELSIKTEHNDAFYSSPATYADCVARAGGVPVLVLSGEHGHSTILEKLDGIVFSGGTDIHPDRYGGKAGHPDVLPHDGLRDAFELKLMKLALENGNIPILAICRGAQLLNVALGGSLIEHLPDHVDDDFHRDENGLWTLHDVEVTQTSRLGRIMGTGHIHTMSGHHQALATVAGHLTVVATSKDKIVEAVELEAHPWCIGVQWHPEETAHRDPSQQNIFDALVAQASSAGPEGR